MINIRKLENELWEAADALRAGSKLTSNQYCMPVLGLIFLRYAYSRFKLIEVEILKDRPMRNGRVMPVEASDFKAKSALYLPVEAQYDYLLNLPEDIKGADLTSKDGQVMTSLGEVVNNAMALIEEQSAQLTGILPKNYTDFSDELLAEILRIFNNSALDEVGGDIIGRIYEYFLNKFAKNIASDDGVFFTPKSLVKMIVNVLEPTHGTLFDPACGSGGMFIQSGDFVNSHGLNANTTMTFYGQEKVEYNAQLCLMNMAVHGLTGVIKSGDEGNSFYNDAHQLEGRCDYIMANPPFNVDKVKSESTQAAGRLPFGMPGINKNKEIGNANYLWISYFYSYLNDTGRAGFVMASSATDSQGKDKNIRESLVKTGAVDGDAVFFGADIRPVVNAVLGRLRNEFAAHFNLKDPSVVAFAWIIDFPFYEWDDHGKKLDFGHNPFGMPKGGLQALESANTDAGKLAIVADQFDMVMNGYEICSGGVRNHNPAVLYKVFDLLGFSESYVEEKFGAMLNAFKYGAPPHAGCAFGVDRILMELIDETNVRETLAFPKNGSGVDVMMESPSMVDPAQLRELGL